MVLFKRKPVQYLPEPVIDDEDKEVWVIGQTGEVFDEYEAYLNRYEFYTQRRFICQITGHSNLTFFEALKSELAGSKEVEEAFPEALKGPVLRRVQFQTISRIDTLVDLIYDEFRADYYPGEVVTVHVITGERLTGTVRDKTRFGPKVLPDGTQNPPFSRYFVSLDNRPTEEAVVDDAHITRDRKLFTKQVLRSFIKKTVTREAWTGAPWLVKHDVAAIYHIDTRVPPHLKYENKAAERRQNLQQKKAAATEFDGMNGGFADLKSSKSHKRRLFQRHKSKPLRLLHPASSPRVSQFPQDPFASHVFQANGPSPVGPRPANFHNSTFAFAPIAAVSHIPAPSPAPPPIKYPIEDLQVAPRLNGPKRPILKYFSQDTPTLIQDKEANTILMKSIGPLLETWDTLNVYCEIFKLDSFTFDDFVEAMQYTSENVQCELFVEVHCAALKLLVESATDGGKVLVQLPELEEDKDQDDTPAGTVMEPILGPEPKAATRATRSSLAKLEAETIRVGACDETPEPLHLHKHRAAELQAEMNWVERLKERDFREGGWEVIMVGLLYQLSKSPRLKKPCEEVLEQLAPTNMEPTQEATKMQYSKLDVNLRIQALEIVCRLCAETKAIRQYMEECSENMTTYRKEKINWQRSRKTLNEELRLLNEERRILPPPNVPQSTEAQAEAAHEVDAKMRDIEEEGRNTKEGDSMDTEEDTTQGRGSRHENHRATNRKRKRGVGEQKIQHTAETEAKASKPSKQWVKLLKAIEKKEDKIKECDDEIATLDNDLREADCPRTRVLGKDRFWNRYYWFERNGMPYTGLPSSSTAEAGYANGCIWVQGPDELERTGYIEMKREWQDEYQAKFNMTVPERKIMEEGETHLFNAHQWGYFDDAETLDKLLDYLDVRGYNELKLKKELVIYRDKIAEHMEKRLEYINPLDDKSHESVKPRVSTRKQREHSHTDQISHRCLIWQNYTALDELGHLHSEQPKPKKTAKKGTMIVSIVQDPAPMKTRSDAKSKKDKGRPLRQGLRYSH